jgi:hypothetical protein
VASWNDKVRIAVYSLPGGQARVWTAHASSLPFLPDVVDLMSWSRAGMLAFNWAGSSPPGAYLLDTNATGGALLAHSKLPLCLPPQSLSGMVISYFGFVTPDGTKIIAPLTKPIKAGQRPPACKQKSPPPGTGQVSTKLEEFSAATGRAIGVVYKSPSPASTASYVVFWSNASGSVLVLDAPTKPGRNSPGVLGVLSGRKFTPIPMDPSTFTSLIAF